MHAIARHRAWQLRESDMTAAAQDSGTGDDSAGQDEPDPAAGAALPPGLYMVSTPIGAARDITLRALDVLAGADGLAAEDTRTLRRLMTIHGIALRGRRIVALHDHNEAAGAEALVARLREGGSLAYASEAGTPLVSDPGFRLVQSAIAAGVPVHAVPGASALLAALVVSGLPSDRVLFAGFAPSTRVARQKWLAEIMAVPATAVIYESPRRVGDLLTDLCDHDADRGVVLCRELTKRFEEVRRGSAREVLEGLPPEGLRGEVVLLVDRAEARPADPAQAAAMLARLAEAGISTRDAVQQVAAATGLNRREVYRLAVSGKDA